MFTTLNRQTNVFHSQLSILSLIGMLLEPTVILAVLLGSATVFDYGIDAPYVLLGLIVFSMTFPGTSRIETRFRRVVREVVFGWLTLVLMLLFFGISSGYIRLFGQEALLVWFVATPIILVIAHELVRQIAFRILSQHENRHLAIVVGMTEIGLRLANQFQNNPFHGTQLLGFFDDRGRDRLDNAGAQERLLGTINQLADFVKEHRIDHIYITLPMASQPRILTLLDQLRDTTVSIFFAPDIFLTDLIQGRMDSVGGMPVVAVCETPFTGVSGLIKRSSDIVLSILILIMISPLLLVIAAGVKLGSPGPILFKQRRYGVDGQEIVVYKFRSMTVCEDGAQITQATRNDQRITRFGSFLRRSSLDELPQFVNVLQGRMSIVGPRPHAVAHNELYRKVIKGYMIRHKVKPGITGWAQVNGYRGETDTVDKMQKRVDYDLEYLRTWSIGMDLWIIVKTVLVVFRDKHAY
ncbi:undecaprenyl-phosphate glucose phosphotransferase [Dechloromonas sp. HYN0024]|uniref:undecaprenyl-phosphate glucose phosphotransferase n=1 Tax=Dechloromonas sp. HYN0024 TaxID=2231055 RepID=UPI000E439670|nr:undecaprenyl-phosphate glucose phosphotransferase [Dechloromonas sp. HYN0024]AXS80123.1 undecaprenyl-phosphate glucose phosphotransferase [Dechloromonas sp. HYN0024]